MCMCASVITLYFMHSQIRTLQIEPQVAPYMVLILRAPNGKYRKYCQKVNVLGLFGLRIVESMLNC